jgi:hypothetical protein
MDKTVVTTLVWLCAALPAKSRAGLNGLRKLV